jgi:hypothetical protein
LILGATVVTGYLGFIYLFPSALSRLAQVETPRAVAKGEVKLNPVLDKVAAIYGTSRSETDKILWNAWETYEQNLLENGLKPSSFAREVLQAAPKKDPDLEKVVSSIAQEEPAKRLTRLHQAKPAPGTYPQQAEFQKILEQLQKKTGLNPAVIASTMVNRWKVVYEKKKQNRNFSLMWFCRIVNSRTKSGMKKAEWQSMVSKIGG